MLGRLPRGDLTASESSRIPNPQGWSAAGGAGAPLRSELRRVWKRSGPVRRFDSRFYGEQVSRFALKDIAERTEYLGFYRGESPAVLCKPIGGAQADPASGPLSELVCGHLVLSEQFREPKTHAKSLRGIPTLDNTRTIPNRGNTLEEIASC
jgi:hypothetical protein